MSETAATRSGILRGIRVLDGGMASELEYMGAEINGPLWSAHVLEDAPDKILAVHRAYLEAGADCIETASYQVSRMGYAEFGLAPQRADIALLHAVSLARTAASEVSDRPVLVAVSLGPYGAALHNGAEYHGNYDCTHDAVVAFHRERIEVLAGLRGGEVLAFETLPSLEEARAIGEALSPFPELAAWFTFTCPDSHHVAHGELLRDCAAYAASLPQTVAIGVNCVRPALVTPLIAELRAASTKPVIVYPNSGEGWNAQSRSWTGTSDPQAFGAKAGEWFSLGAQIIGGCCRTRPQHIRQVAEAAARVPSPAHPRA